MNSSYNTKRNFHWRVVDITVASVIGVACAVLYWGVDLAYTAFQFLDATVPGAMGLINGLWLIAGPLALIIVRKPGAAIYAEVVGAIVESMLGNQWGLADTFVVGLEQGIGAEIVFAVLMYKSWNLWLTMLSGAVSGLCCWAHSFFKHIQSVNWAGPYGLVNMITSLVSGAFFAGFLVWMLYLGIAQTGALDHFESGRAIRGAKFAESDTKETEESRS